MGLVRDAQRESDKPSKRSQEERMLQNIKGSQKTQSENHECGVTEFGKVFDDFPRIHRGWRLKQGERIMA